MARHALRLILLTLVLFALWLLLSGNYKAWLVYSGLGASVLVVVFSLSKGVLDSEGAPFERLPRAIVYWGWLAWQIVLSGLNVTRLILGRELAISPSMVAVTAKADSPVGLTTYANSITLTPGTISVEVSERLDVVWVHAITRENAAGFEDDPMNRWVGWVDGNDWTDSKEWPT